MERRPASAGWAHPAMKFLRHDPHPKNPAREHISLCPLYIGRADIAGPRRLDTLNVLSYRTAIDAAKIGDRAKNGGYDDGGEN